MSMNYEWLQLDLHVFDGGEGGAAASGVTGNAAGSQSGSDAAGEANGSAPQSAEGKGQVAAAKVSPEDRVKAFEDLIKGEYKDLYDQRVKDTVQSRIKGLKETEGRYNALSPVLDILSKKYGVDAQDIEALTKAIEDDDSYFEEEALERGISVDQLKAIRKMERENADLRKQMQESKAKAQAEQDVAKWMNEAEKVKETYPEFNLRAELSNDRFVRFLKNGFGVEASYEAVHCKELIAKASESAAKAAETQTVNKIIANGARPSENGSGSGNPGSVKVDVAKLTKAELEEYSRRARRGERITFQ